jgi:hypothetical protein
MRNGRSGINASNTLIIVLAVCWWLTFFTNTAAAAVPRVKSLPRILDSSLCGAGAAVVSAAVCAGAGVRPGAGASCSGVGLTVVLTSTSCLQARNRRRFFLFEDAEDVSVYCLESWDVLYAPRPLQLGLSA